MLDIELIRSQPEDVERALLKRMATVDLAPVLEADRRVRQLRTSLNGMRERRHQIAAAVGAARRNGEAADTLQAEAVELKGALAAAEQELTGAETQLATLMAELPNLPDDRVPAGGKEANAVLGYWGEKPALGSDFLDHVELATRHKLVDFERGVKLGGSGFWLYTGDGAALEWALLNYFCQTHYKAGYTFNLPPHLLIPECGYAAGQFPKFSDDVFHIETKEGGQRRFLLPTSETALLNLYRDEIIPSEALPLKLFAYSPCYRREAGGARSDERGTVRGHQFNKVELFQFVAAEQAEAALAEMLGRAEELLQALGLHYRKVLLAAEDASASMKLTYDLEVWLPSVGRYKEVTSVSWAGDYQARRAMIRHRPAGQKQTRLVHTLNASALATSRLLPAIFEQHQLPGGEGLRVPGPLQAWLGKSRIGA